MAYEKIVPESTFKTIKWSQDPDKKGEFLGKTIECYLLETREIMNKDGSLVTIYKVKIITPESKVGEVYDLWGLKVLRDLMSSVLPGERVKITSLGKPTGKTYYNFDLERDATDVIEVTGEDESEPKF